MTKSSQESMSWYILLLNLLLNVANVSCLNYKQLYNFYLLINPGLSPPLTAASFDDCISLCSTAANCSAISYKASGKACVLSYCSILHLKRNTGWNSYLLINYTVFAESVTYVAPDYEWMLTDSCGFTSTGKLSGAPAMALTGSGAKYSLSQSNYVGNALQMDNVASMNVMTSGSPFFNMKSLEAGFTYSGWFKYITVNSHAYLEFGCCSSSWNYGTHFWLYNGGLFYNLVDYGVSTKSTTVAYTPPVNTWIHVALSYDPATRAITWFINGTLFQSITLNVLLSSSNPQYSILVGGRSTYATSGLIGQVYCIRLYLRTLNNSDIWTNAKACNGRIRFS